MSQHDVVLLLGSNLNNPEKNLEKAIALLEHLEGTILSKSEILKTAPVEFDSNNFFCNIELVYRTKLSPVRLLDAIKSIEIEMGRSKDSKAIGRYEDRIIDIDIVKYSNLRFVCEKLIIPHQKHLYEREFSQVLLKELEH